MGVLLRGGGGQVTARATPGNPASVIFNTHLLIRYIAWNTDDFDI